MLLSMIIVSKCLPMEEILIKDPELNAGYFEGDMVLHSNQKSGLRDNIYRWKNNTVPYRFHTKFGNSTSYMVIIN